MIAWRSFLYSSVVAVERTVICPRPVVWQWTVRWGPGVRGPVGKSAPCAVGGGAWRAHAGLPMPERIAHGEGLGQPHHRLVDGGRAVWVVVAGDVPGDLGGLSEGAVVEQVQLAHRHEDTAVHRLQSVADVRERARDDDRHRIVDVRI